MKKLSIFFVAVLLLIPFIFGQSACELRLQANNPRLANMLNEYRTNTEVGMLQNSDLEDQQLDSFGNLYIPGFYTTWSGADSIRQETVNIHSGTKAVAVTKVDGMFDTLFYSGGPPECECIPWTRVFPGETVRFEFWTAGAPGYYSIENGSTYELIVPKTSTGAASQVYFLVTGDVVIPANCEYLRIYLYAPDNGTTYYDDINFKAIVNP